ncbi:hypothetical protein Pdw03_4823 [Penicillium digitatum]|uniref:Uncharacterized protein n=1 Tax=Penicillium digitatum TaxID=36651 RepID=A0A7T6XIW9_PENDI|nr:hypothetical protein Pdw03_4823 [Penicillium digitatum]
MCSIYIYEYDCGCKQQEGGVVPCANQNTPACKVASGALNDSGCEAVHRYALCCHQLSGFPALSVSASS